MTFSLTLSLGYLTIPFHIKHSIKSFEITSAEEEDEITSSSSHWTFGNTICITSFVQSPPNAYPTIEKHVLQIAQNANKVEKEITSILSNAFSKNYYGLVLISTDLLGIISSTEQSNIFTLQIVQYDTSIFSNISQQKQPQQKAIAMNRKSYNNNTMISNNNNNEENVLLDLDQPPKPFEIMELCQQWPASETQLTKLAKQIYKTASLYGYWDYWRVFEGICNGHHINSQQLLK